METSDIVIGITGLIVVIALMLGIPYGCYRYGKYAERRTLTQFFVQMTQDTYYDGFKDGHKQGMTDCPTLDQLLDKEDADNGRY